MQSCNIGLNCHYVVLQEQQYQQDLVEFEHEKQVAEMREKSTPEKVSYYVL